MLRVRKTNTKRRLRSEWLIFRFQRNSSVIRPELNGLPFQVPSDGMRGKRLNALPKAHEITTSLGGL